MVCVSERTQRFFERRTPKASFLFIPKSKKMKKELKPSEILVRQLTVSYLYQSGRPDIPFIRLHGKWLKDAGFFPSDRISVTVEQKKLVIEMIEKIKQKK